MHIYNCKAQKNINIKLESLIMPAVNDDLYVIINMPRSDFQIFLTDIKINKYSHIFILLSF